MVWTSLPFIWSGQNHLASTVKWGRRQGRQKKTGEDNIRVTKSERAVVNREKWRKLVVKSSMVPL